MSKYLNIKANNIDSLKSFWEYDDAYTAPIHGFSSAEDYYMKSSSKQYLKDITTETLIINSKDDPFMHNNALPRVSEVSKSVELELTEYGGHLGFVSGTLFKPDYWLEKRIPDFLAVGVDEAVSR